jgi:hypothetical protein
MMALTIMVLALNSQAVGAYSLRHYLVMGSIPGTRALYSWNDCAQECEAIGDGWHIACIKNDDDTAKAQAAVELDIAPLPIAAGIWIGLSAPNQADWAPPYINDKFVWHRSCENAIQEQYTHWFPDAPDNNNVDGKNCIELSGVLDPNDRTPFWNGAPCDAQKYCMCSRNASGALEDDEPSHPSSSLSYSMSYSTLRPSGPIGGDKDEYGCYVAAGYSWCAPLAACVRSWETDEPECK